MWVEELRLDNIKCFTNQTIKLGTSKEPYKWVTLLGENGTGKTTILQALALLLAGPEGAKSLLDKPENWLQSEEKKGEISTILHQDENDLGTYGKDKKTTKFQYEFYLTGNTPLTLDVKNKNQPLITYHKPSIIVETQNRFLGWLRDNALMPYNKSWFAAGYGAFRRLTRKGHILVADLQTPSRETNFSTQFKENEPLESFETWLLFLDFQLLKVEKDSADFQKYTNQKKSAIHAINLLLPKGCSFHEINTKGQILFNVGGVIVSILTLSDGYRSILAFAGDLIWRLTCAFPSSPDPLKEKGVVLIDELDIHLHPTWQRDIAKKLQELFPNLQFIVATHSPLITAGAGSDAVTYRFERKAGQISIEKIENLSTKSADEVLTSEAFGLVSEYSPQTQEKIDKYDQLKRKSKRTEAEEKELHQLSLFVKTVLNDSPDPLEKKMDDYIATFFNNPPNPPKAK